MERAVSLVQKTARMGQEHVNMQSTNALSVYLRCAHSARQVRQVNVPLAKQQWQLSTLLLVLVTVNALGQTTTLVMVHAHHAMLIVQLAQDQITGNVRYAQDPQICNQIRSPV